MRRIINSGSSTAGRFALILSDSTHRAALCEWLLRELGATWVTLEPGGLGHAPDVSILKTLIAEHRTQNAEHPTTPDLLIGAGTQVTDWLLLASALYPSALSVHLFDPMNQYDRFDLIVLPEHDPHPELPHIITTLGLMNKVSARALSAAKKEIEEGKYGHISFAHLPAPRVALLLGGRHIGGNITPGNATELASSLNAMIGGAGGSLLVSTSMRTEAETAQALKHGLKMPHDFYNWSNREGRVNPYMAYLALADIIIVSGDSIRMLSEAVSAGKPVYIYHPSGSESIYRPLHRLLIERGYARPYEAFDVTWRPQVEPLNEVKRVAEITKGKLAEKKAQKQR